MLFSAEFVYLDNSYSSWQHIIRWVRDRTLTSSLSMVFLQASSTEFVYFDNSLGSWQHTIHWVRDRTLTNLLSIVFWRASSAVLSYSWITPRVRDKDMAQCVRDRTLTDLLSMAFLARFLSSFELSLDDSLSSWKIHGSLRSWQDTHRFVINGLFARFLSSSEVHFCLRKFFFHARWVSCSASSWRLV